MTSTTTTFLVGGLGGMELLIILAVLVLLFGASKLPELARGSGQALRIFKAETKDLTKDSTKDRTDDRTSEASGDVARAQTAPVTKPVSEPVSEPVIVESPREHDAPRG